MLVTLHLVLRLPTAEVRKFCKLRLQLVRVAKISLISPPIGLNVFVPKSVVADISIGTIFQGVMPFWLDDLVRLAVLLVVPALSLMLIP